MNVKPTGEQWQNFYGLQVNPKEFTMSELASEIANAVGSKIKIIHLPLPQDDPKQCQPNIERAKELLKQNPTIPLAEGLKKTIAYFSNRIQEKNSMDIA